MEGEIFLYEMFVDYLCDADSYYGSNNNGDRFTVSQAHKVHMLLFQSLL